MEDNRRAQLIEDCKFTLLNLCPKDICCIDLAHRLALYINNVCELHNRLCELVRDVFNLIYVQWAQELEEHRRAFYENDAQDMFAHDQIEYVNQCKEEFEAVTEVEMRQALIKLGDVAKGTKGVSALGVADLCERFAFKCGCL